MEVGRRRTGRASRAAMAGVLGLAAWGGPSAFAGLPGFRASTPRTSMQGYRFDKMLEKSDGTYDLQTTDGYWVGECGFIKSQEAQGYRYRMKPLSSELGKTEDCRDITRIGPFKMRFFTHAFGGATGNNAKMRELKKRLGSEVLKLDPAKVEENVYWMKRYGHKRWGPKYVDQSTGLQKNFFRGLAAWSGADPLKEERGTKWIEADYGKPWLAKTIGRHIPGFVSKAQLAREYNTGKVGAGDLPPGQEYRKERISKWKVDKSIQGR